MQRQCSDRMARQDYVRLRILLSEVQFFMKVLFTLLFINSTNLIENEHDFVFFD